MIIKRCIICIGTSDFITNDLTLTKDKSKALVLTGRKVAKGLVNYLKKNGVTKISLIEV
jgi:hypothetical protein